MKSKLFFLIICVLLLFSACTSTKEVLSTEPFLESIESNVSTTYTTGDKNKTEKNISKCELDDDKLMWNSSNLREIVNLIDTDIDELPDAIIKNCIDKLNADFVTCDKLSGIKVAIFDINNDGVDDYFVVPFPADYAGNGTPPLYLFVFENNEIKLIDIPIETDCYIKILNSKTNDYNDLYGDDFGNVFNYNGQNTYIGQRNNNISVCFLHSVIENDTICIRVSIPYEISDFSEYYLKMCLLDKNFNKILITTSNDNQYNNIKYSNSSLPVNGEYRFYIKSSDWSNFDLNDYLVEFQCVDAS